MLKSAVLKAKELGSEIVIGTDNDLNGSKYAEWITELAPDASREVPQAKDWNEDLEELRGPKLEM